VAAIIGDEVGPELIHDQRLQDRQLGPKLVRKWGQNSPAKPRIVTLPPPRGICQVTADAGRISTVVPKPLSHSSVIRCPGSLPYRHTAGRKLKVSVDNGIRQHQAASAPRRHRSRSASTPLGRLDRTYVIFVVLPTR
jgi:hypothetical protein